MTTGEAGAREQVELWVSECGRYLARAVPQSNDCTAYDVIEVATRKVWLHGRRKLTGFSDPRRKFAEFPQMVSGWSNRGRGLRSGRWIRAFDLSFADVDTTIEIKAFSGNVVLTNYEAEFRRKVPANHARRHADAARAVAEELARHGQAKKSAA